LAIAVIGDLTISTFITLILIPVVYATVRGLASRDERIVSEQK